MGFGDELMAAGCAERVHREWPGRRVAICDLAGKPRWHELWLGNPAIAPPSAVERGEVVNRIHNAPGCRPYLRYPFTVQTGWKFTEWSVNANRGHLYLTPRETVRAEELTRELGPFVVVENSLARTSNPNKAWLRDRWPALIEACPDLTFVQFLHRDSIRLPGAQAITTSTFREACAVLARAMAFVGTEGGLHHAAAALERPAVVLFGGCASPAVTGYADHLNLADDGPGSPCGRYLPCGHCAAAMARISVDQVATALRDLLLWQDPDRLLVDRMIANLDADFARDAARRKGRPEEG